MSIDNSFKGLKSLDSMDMNKWGSYDLSMQIDNFIIRKLSDDSNIQELSPELVDHIISTYTYMFNMEQFNKLIESLSEKQIRYIYKEKLKNEDNYNDLFGGFTATDAKVAFYVSAVKRMCKLGMNDGVYEYVTAYDKVNDIMYVRILAFLLIYMNSDKRIIDFLISKMGDEEFRSQVSALLSHIYNPITTDLEGAEDFDNYNYYKNLIFENMEVIFGGHKVKTLNIFIYMPFDLFIEHKNELEQMFTTKHKFWVYASRMRSMTTEFAVKNKDNLIIGDAIRAGIITKENVSQFLDVMDDAIRSGAITQLGFSADLIRQVGHEKFIDYMIIIMSRAHITHEIIREFPELFKRTSNYDSLVEFQFVSDEDMKFLNKHTDRKKRRSSNYITAAVSKYGFDMKEFEYLKDHMSDEKFKRIVFNVPIKDVADDELRERFYKVRKIMRWGVSR